MTEAGIAILDYAPRHRTAFKALNLAWLLPDWGIEEKDRAALDDPERAILAAGGAILIAERDGRAVGCCALLPAGDREMELAKTAVASDQRGRGIGRQLVEAAAARARAMGARRLVLETNRAQAPAAALYRSVGFVELEGRATAFGRSDIFMALDLDAGAGAIRPCTAADRDRMIEIINAAASAYRGVIPADCWHEPYMPAAVFDAECRRGVVFHGFVEGGLLVGVMGVEPVRNVILIRHAYVDPDRQGRGIGGALLRHLMAESPGQILVGTWADASWAIALYRRHGFALPSPPIQQRLLATYWAIPARMAEVSVALASPALTDAEAERLIATA